MPRPARGCKLALARDGDAYTKVTDDEVVTRTVLRASYALVEVREVRRGLRPHDRRLVVTRSAWRRWVRDASPLTSAPIPV